MSKIFLANFKMNFNLDDIENYFENFLRNINIKNNQVGFFVPYTFLMQTKELLKDTKLLVGAQNVHFKESGAFTGEISATMIKNCNADMVLIGHSERRKFFKETDEEINKKIKKLMKHNLRAVLCIGEKKEERESGLTDVVIYNQLKATLAGLYENEFENLIIAYEPVWAIGTGEVASNKIIEDAVTLIRKIIKDLYNSELAESTKIIYGGSISSKNCKTLSKIKNINGFLIGGASLNYNEFSEIINS
ncbi:MAG: triose-phosphate isomerase [Clostridia bacterium]|nr:triose-phosphate isomerase [Clostridia bacterium]